MQTRRSFPKLILQWQMLALFSIGAHAAIPRLEVVRLDGQTETGTLVSIAPEVNIAVAEGVVSLPWSDILSIRPVDAGPTSKPADSLPLEITLADGSILAGEIAAANEGKFGLRLASGQACVMSLPDLRCLRVRAAPAAAQDKMSELLRQAADDTADQLEGERAAEGSDIAVVARGSEVVVLRGHILQIEPERVLVAWNGREVPVPWGRLGGLILARSAPRRAPCIVRLNTGDAIAGQVTGGTAEALQIRSGAFEQEVEIAWVAVERIDCHSERLVVLSDLKPARYEFEPFFDKAWNYAADATLTGRPIRLGGRTFSRGVAMHSRSRLFYTLDGRFERFTAAAGILDEMGRRGCVALRVRGDGRVLWSATGVRGGEPPREVAVDIAGVRELALEVDYDADLDLSDQAAWGFARLIR